jgi:hypothetical protein
MLLTTSPAVSTRFAASSYSAPAGEAGRPVDLLSLLPSELPRSAADLARDARRMESLSLTAGEQLR